MSKISKKSLKEIFDITGFILAIEDVLYFCNDMQTLQKLSDYSEQEKITATKLQAFLFKHEDKLDKEKLVLVLYDNLKQSIQGIDKMLLKLNNKIQSSSGRNLLELKTQISELQYQKIIHKEFLEDIKKLLPTISKVVSIYHYDKSTAQTNLRIIDPQKELSKSNSNYRKNLKRFNEIDNFFKQADSKDGLGIEYMLQSIMFTDFYEIFPDEQFGDNIRTLLLENAAITQKLITRKELNALQSKDYEKYCYILESINTNILLTDVKNVLEKYIEYVDIDKLITICAYRFEEGLENKSIKPKSFESVKEILAASLIHLKNTNKVFKYKLQIKNENYIDKEFEYSGNDIIKCLSRFVGDTYLTKDDIAKKTQEITSGKATLLDLDSAQVLAIFSDNQLEELATLNDENLQYVSTSSKWDRVKILNTIVNRHSCSTNLLNHLITQQNILPADIIHLYMLNILSLDQIKQIKNNINLEDSINSYDLIQYYEYSSKEDSTEQEKQNYNKYLNIYKEIKIPKNSEQAKNPEGQEKLENQANELMEQMIENNNYENKEKYLYQLEEFYKQGLLTLNVILEWNDEAVIKDFITELFKESAINLEGIKLFIKNGKLPFEYIKELVWVNDITYEKRIKILEEGWVPEEEIAKLFSETLIRKEDLLALTEKSIISLKTANNIINQTSLQDLESHSGIVLKVDDTIQKIKGEQGIYSDIEKYPVKEDKPRKVIIDPNERKEFFNLLGLVEPDDVLISETSPFYNYEFYYMPNENGNIDLDSVVVAERIYEIKEKNLKDNDTEIKFATDNATYFFKYRDLMVLSNYMKKQEAVKEKENIIFRANHTLSTDKKNGHWGASVLFGIAKTMLSSDLKEYTIENQRKIIVEKLLHVYGYDKLNKILDKSEEIDLGDYNCKIIENDDGERL